MAPCFVDAGFLIAVCHPSDQHHDEAVEWVEILEADRTPLLTTEFCLIELVDHLSQVGQRHLGRQLIDDFYRHEDVEVVECRSSLMAEGLELHRKRDDKSWGLTDCISFVVMNKRGIQRVLSFDEDFEQAGKRLLTASEEG